MADIARGRRTNTFWADSLHAGPYVEIQTPNAKENNGDAFFSQYINETGVKVGEAYAFGEGAANTLHLKHWIIVY